MISNIFTPGVGLTSPFSYELLLVQTWKKTNKQSDQNWRYLLLYRRSVVDEIVSKFVNNFVNFELEMTSTSVKTLLLSNQVAHIAASFVDSNWYGRVWRLVYFILWMSECGSVDLNKDFKDSRETLVNCHQHGIAKSDNTRLKLY